MCKTGVRSCPNSSLVRPSWPALAEPKSTRRPPLLQSKHGNKCEHRIETYHCGHRIESCAATAVCASGCSGKIVVEEMLSSKAPFCSVVLLRDRNVSVEKSDRQGPETLHRLLNRGREGRRKSWCALWWRVKGENDGLEGTINVVQ